MSGNFMTAGGPAHAQDQLQALPPHLQGDVQITAHLASRFHVQMPISHLSSQGFVAFNTFTSTAKGPEGSKEGTAVAACDDLATRAFTRLGTRQENQAVLFLGDSGSGKTTLRKHFMASLLSLSSTPLSTKLGQAEFIFDSLTSTKSTTTPIASKAGLFYELQYETTSSIHPTLIGGKLLDHRLERSRIAAVPTGERSFHILYYLLAGTSAAEKNHLGLDTVSHGNAADALPGHEKRWRYLGHPTQLKVGVDDAAGFQAFKTALRRLEFPRSDIAEICQTLASILHIGQLEFHTTQSTTPAPDDSGGYSHEGGENITAVKNKDVLNIIAAFLGVSTQELETSLGYKTKTLHRERVTVMLDPVGARANADELARTLYSLLVAYVIEHVNQRTCAVEEVVGNTVSIVDFPGFAHQTATGSVLDQLLNNAACESLQNYCLQSFFERKSQLLETEEVVVPPSSYFDNSDAFKGLLKPGNGLLSILDDQMRRGKNDAQFHDAIRKRFDNKNPAISCSDAMATVPGSNFATHNSNASFTVRHFAGEVEYPIEGLLEENSEVVSGDLMNLVSSTKSDFIRTLFGQDALQPVYHPKEKTAIMQATLSSKPSRAPSMARRTTTRPGRFGTKKNTGSPKPTTGEEESGGNSRASRKSKVEAIANQGAASEFLSALDNITTSLSAPDMNPYFVYCLKPNDRRIANQFDSKCVRNQVLALGIPEISQRLRNADFSVFLPFSEFLGLAEAEHLMISSDKDKAEAVLDEKRWPINEARVGSTGVLLSERCWKSIAKISHDEIPRIGEAGRSGSYDSESRLHHSPGNKLDVHESKTNLLGSPSPMYLDDKAAGYFGSRDMDTKSEAGASAFNTGDMFRNMDTREEMAEKGNEKRMEEVDVKTVSGSRKRWMFLVWLLTFYIPDFAIRYIGRIKRKDVRTAWREKLAINLLIWAACGFVVFFIVIFPELICPRQYVYTQAELTSYNGQDGAAAYVAIRGVVFDLDKFLPSHYPHIVPDKSILKYAGRDASTLFPVQVSGVCQGKTGTVDDRVDSTWQSSNYTDSTATISSNDPNAQYHDFRWSVPGDYRPHWFTEQMLFLERNYYLGKVGYPPKYLSTLAGKDTYIGYINNRVYDLTAYFQATPPLQNKPGDNGTDTSIDRQYMDSSVTNLFQQFPGTDLTQRFQNLDLDAGMRHRMQICMDNLFYVGDVDTRGSTQCLFARYILLAVSILLVSVIGFKFLAALQFGGKNIPENLDKFVMCTVPAYTEDEDSLRRAIDSAARMRYDDKRKLLVIICDGMIIGQGNDRPTPRIVLDILGVPETVDPEPLSFESLGEGMKQHNMGKVYSGLYEVQGHIVPFLVIVKIGKPSEVSRPGNRGKRDSQMILMRFLNRVHYNLPMTPMELEMHHQIRNIIGVNPTFYEFLLQIDADTVVAPDSATRFVSAFLHDTRLIGACGETALTNAKASFVTMMQVYEYYISHNLTKAFESLFGSVTCLPGCFSMYRIRAAETGKPLFVSKEVVEAYSEIRVDTLHMKNLLHLGEDRYLTTLLLKFHGKYKTKYIFRAHAWTIAPDSWKVFLSQRRRWINSTVHNLMELIPLQQLCGFCCFSMRFVVFLDLLSTIVQPVIIGYLVYLIVLIVQRSSVVPITAFILLGAIYGLQAIIFILRRKWEMIGWMIIYVIATPVFACGLPLYAFWNMDDFSWGSTRIITGEKGRQIVVSDEGKFDPKSIPRKRWEEYQAELWEAQTQHDEDDAHSMVSGISYATKSNWVGGSIYGGGPGNARSEFGIPPSRPMSSADLVREQSMNTLPRYPSQLSLGQQQFLGSSGSVAGGFEMSDFAGNLPSDDAILAEIRDILNQADLMTVTKKSVKAELEKRFGCNLEAKRLYIGSATEAVLAGQL
ncbi:hypothetical protein FH972_021468 [Carpinus fangiana]|uniref:chitin synthase n=1 Tax=Carpinus fangiana TaxID=176857 RepID=A0A5N6KPT0_9ROSI|nr:hypothetical protein FH972_021468 [Carpinus fangiana]